jgi:hypothetical protein
MAEQSHKTEMAAALRGDFERLRRRRGDTVTLDVPSPAPDSAEPPAETQPEPPASVSLLTRLLRR